MEWHHVALSYCKHDRAIGKCLLPWPLRLCGRDNEKRWFDLLEVTTEEFGHCNAPIKYSKNEHPLAAKLVHSWYEIQTPQAKTGDESKLHSLARHDRAIIKDRDRFNQWLYCFLVSKLRCWWNILCGCPSDKNTYKFRCECIASLVLHTLNIQYQMGPHKLYKFENIQWRCAKWESRLNVQWRHHQ